MLVCVSTLGTESACLYLMYTLGFREKGGLLESLCWLERMCSSIHAMLDEMPETELPAPYFALRSLQPESCGRRMMLNHVVT